MTDQEYELKEPADVLFRPRERILNRISRFLGYRSFEFAKMIWQLFPRPVLESKPFVAVGQIIYDRLIRDRDRRQSHWTRFLRNQPQMEVLAKLLADRVVEDPTRILVTGCSTGAELYSIAWVTRSHYPDIQVNICGLDISPGAIEVARTGVFFTQSASVVPGEDVDRASEVAELDPETASQLFVDRKDSLVVREWLCEGVSWFVGNIMDSEMLSNLGQYDAVTANNFLGPMEDVEAEAALNNITSLVKRGGFLVVEGVDLDIKTRVLEQKRFVPVNERLKEIYFADPWKQDWPWYRWSHEPINAHRPDYLMRYSTIYQAPGGLA